MDSKVWKHIIVYYQKSSERGRLQSSMTLVSTVSPANFERRLRTSLEGIDKPSLARAKYESGRLKIRNTVIVNRNKWDSKSQNLTLVIFQRQFLLQKKAFEKKVFHKTNRRSSTTWKDKKSAILVVTYNKKIFSSSYYACIFLTLKGFFLLFWLQEFAIFHNSQYVFDIHMKCSYFAIERRRTFKANKKIKPKKTNTNTKNKTKKTTKKHTNQNKTKRKYTKSERRIHYTR